MKHTHLFEPGHIGNLKIRNRTVMAPMGTLLGHADGEVSDHQIAYYAERARGGTGLIITEILAVEPQLGKAVAIQTRVDDDRFIPGLGRLAAASQKYGARIFPQLHHAGVQSNSRICGGKQIVAPSAIVSKAVGETARALSTEEVRELVQHFIAAAVRCQIAGFDGVELHGAHGYLINQFSSPHTNKREDEYGGNFENRMRFFTEILQGIKKECGSDFPVIARYSAEEFIDGGITLEDGIAIGQHLADHGADALHVSCGTYESMPTLLEPITYEQGWRVNLGETIKEKVDIPVVTVGVIRKPDFANDVLASGKADFIALGRGLLADPEWPNKAAAGLDENICPCISCLYCVDRIFAPNHIACAVNARTGRELEFSEYVDEGEDKVVAIVGGGPAGMEAARVLALRGFRPVLYEKQDELGGELLRGCRPPKKEAIQWYRDYLVQQMKSLEIETHLGEEITPDKIKATNPYTVLIAMGAESIMPESIPGIPGDGVITALQALEEDIPMKPNQHIAVVGGGLTGCEIADMYASSGMAVTVVEQLPDIAPNTNQINRLGIEKRLKDTGVSTLTGKRLTKVSDGTIEIVDVETDTKDTLDADWVIVSLGLTPPHARIKEWMDAFPQAQVIGDAVEARRVAEAVRESFDAAWSLP